MNNYKLIIVCIVAITSVSCALSIKKPEKGERFVITINNNSIEDYSNDYRCEIDLYEHASGAKMKQLFYSLQKKNLELADGSSYYYVELYMHNESNDALVLDFGNAGISKEAEELLLLIDAACP